MTADFAAASQQKPCRRWLRYSLRTLMLSIVPIACITAWLGYEYRQGQRQRVSITWVEEQGGDIVYHSETNWRERLDTWFPRRVWKIDLGGRPVSDVEPLAGLESVEVLWLHDTQVSDLKPLAELEHLWNLRLDKTQVSDLTPLAGLENLEKLLISYTEVSDLTPLAGLANLKELWLFDTPVSDLEPLARLEQLLNLGSSERRRTI